MSIPKLAGLETEFAIVARETLHSCSQLVASYGLLLSGADDTPIDYESEAPCFASIGHADRMLVNGARFYVDHAHPEYSTPESIDPLQVVQLDMAGTEIVRRCAEIANRSRSPDDQIRLYKNNSDHLGNSYGCHENYLMEAGVFELMFGERQDLIFDYVLPFLISRIVFTGAGKVGAENGSEPVPYQLSQRADFFEELIGLQTTSRRPIVNTRDEPHADPARFRRLHVIAGDANRCPYASWLKIGTMQIFLRMLEDDALGGSFRLSNPLKAVRQVSHDDTLDQLVDMADGGKLTGVQLQLGFFEKAQQYFTGNHANESEKEIMEAWEHTLVALNNRPWSLLGKLDWVTKRQILTTIISQEKWEWNDPRVHLLDIKYHALDPNESLFALAEELGVIVYPPGFDPAAIRRYLLAPPSDTRAYLRGRCIAKYAAEIRSIDWEEVNFKSVSLKMDDPLAWNKQAVEEVFRKTSSPEELVLALSA